MTINSLVCSVVSKLAKRDDLDLLCDIIHACRTHLVVISSMGKPYCQLQCEQKCHLTKVAILGLIKYYYMRKLDKTSC